MSSAQMYPAKEGLCLQSNKQQQLGKKATEQTWAMAVTDHTSLVYQKRRIIQPALRFDLSLTNLL